MQTESGPFVDLGNEVVVVGAEPPSRPQWGDGVGPQCGGEVAIERVGDIEHPRWQRTEHDRGVEQVIAIGEGADRDGVQTGGGEYAKVGVAELAGGGVQLCGVGGSGPVGLDGAVELAMGSDPGQAENGCGERN